MFYVYAYLDPRKPGRFSYEKICFLYEPFYVGKGSGNRMFFHLKKSELSKNIYKSNKINNILYTGLEPIIVKIFEFDLEEESYEYESRLISDIGREVLNDGSLVNLTEGGKGGLSGYVYTEEQRLSKSTASKIAQSKPEYREIRREIAINNFKNEKIKIKHRENTIKSLTKESIEKGKRWLKDEEKKQNMILKVKESMRNNKEYRSQIQKETWSDIELLNRHKIIMSEINNRPEVKKKIREASIKKLFQYDLELNFIKVWDSVSDAANELKISASAISNNCRGLTKKSNGFIWAYTELFN